MTSGVNRASTATIVNTIARGRLIDLEASKDVGPATVETSHSNYATTSRISGGTISDDGTSQTSGTQTAAQLLMNPIGGDLHERVGSQTIGAGMVNPTNGSLDFDNEARVFAPATACAGTDIGADQFVPAGAPLIADTTASAVGETTATVSATSNPLGTGQLAHYDYGPAGPGGTAPTAVSSTSPQCLGVGATAQPVTAALSRLQPGTTYYFRLVATNGAGTTTPTFTAKFTTGGSKPASTSAPKVSGSPTVGHALSASTGAWSGTAPISFTYQWQRCSPTCANITGATRASYTLVAVDLGRRFARW